MVLLLCISSNLENEEREKERGEIKQKEVMKKKDIQPVQVEMALLLIFYYLS